MKLKISLTLFLGLLFPLVTFSQLGGDFESEREDNNEILEGDWVTQFKVPTYPSSQWTVFTVYSSFSSSGELVTTTIKTMYVRSPIGAPLKNEMPPERLVQSYRYVSEQEGYGKIFIYNKYGLLVEKGEIIIDSSDRYRYRNSSGSFPVLTYTRAQNTYFRKNQKDEIEDFEESIKISNEIKDKASCTYCCGCTGQLVCHDCSGDGIKMIPVQKSESVLNPNTNQYEYKLVDKLEPQNCIRCNGNGRVPCPTPTRCKEGG